MSVENDFIPFAVGGSANVLTQAAYAALTTLTQNGFTAGIAPSIQLNKVWRQSSIMAAVIADFIVANAGQPAIDDGTTATLLSNLMLAIAVVARQNPVLSDTGAANAYVVANAAAFAAYPTVSGLVIDVSIAHANTGASTINVDGLGTKPILGLGLQPLQGSELIAQGVASLLYVVASTVNSGNGAFVVLECTGGAQQIAPATASQHAMQLGQATGRWISRVIYQTHGTFSETPPAGATLAVYDVVGAGGGGGSAAATSGVQASGGAGGGYGGRAIKRVANPTAQTITVGLGGVGGNLGASGSTGGTSSAGSLCSATGGTGGSAGTSGSGGAGVGTPGGTGTGGDLNIKGAPGLGAMVFASLNFGYSGTGGSGIYGAGGPAVASFATGSSGAGNGSGAAGGLALNSSGAAASGGTGTDGIVIIDYYS